MSEDLLTRIQRETHERLRELRSAVDEHDRLAAELQELQALPGPAAVSESVAGSSSLAVLDPPLASKPPDLPDSLLVPRSSLVNTMRLPTGRSLPRTPAVSPKVARLMQASRRPELERPGIARVSARALRSLEDDLAVGVDLFPSVDPCLGLDDVDVEAERYERSL